MTNEQMSILRNIIGAVETGGQVYGKQRYDAFTNPGANTEKERYITLGAWQFYGVEGTELLRMIRAGFPAKFKELDTQGIGNDLDKTGFVAYVIKSTTAKAKCIVNLIDSAVGISCQNSLIDKRLNLYIERAKTNGITDVQTQMMWANMQHLGGKDAAERVLKSCKKPHTLDSLYTGLNKDLDTNAQYPNRIGAKRFNSRHVKVYGWIKQYATTKEETQMAISIILAGHGSGKPSTKDMNTYCNTRYTAGRGLVEVRRFPVTDAQRRQMHDLYKTILGRNTYNQSLRDYCYTPYKGAYYSDCSSSICRTAQKVGVTGVSSLNTAGMHYDLTKVEGIVIKNGIIQNPELLKVGDALMLKGSDPSRPLQIGHTEMVYEINGQSSTTTTGGTCEVKLKSFVKGNTDAQVKTIQRLLNALGYKGKDGKALTADGEFGANTEYAVAQFQKDKGITVNTPGTVGEKTWTALVNAK